MSLKHFHILFVTLSILIALYFGVWCIRGPYLAEGGGFGDLLLGLFSILAGVTLVVYLCQFIKKIRNAKTFLAGIFLAGYLLMPELASACPICMRNITGRQADAINAGILTLLFCILSVLVCFAVFFIYLVRKKQKAVN